MSILSLVSTGWSIVSGLFSGGSDGSKSSKTAIIIAIILGIIVFILLIIIHFKNDSIESLEKDLVLSRSNVEILQQTIEEQNKAIDNARADYKKITDEFGRLGNILDERYAKLVVKEGEKFRAAKCEDKLTMLQLSFVDFKDKLNEEIRSETAQ